MYKWEKLGRVFDPTSISGKPWLKEFAQGPSVLITANTVRVYFSCRPERDKHGQYVSYSSWLDLDRRNLLRVVRISDSPILSLGSAGTFDEFGTYPVSVIEHEGSIRAYYGGWTRCESVPFNVAIGLAISEDGGETFQKLGLGPTLGHSLEEPFVISGPKVRRFNGRWYLFYIAGSKWKLVDGRAEPVYKIRAAESEDGINWQKWNYDLIEARLEADEAQASPDVFFSNGKYHMFFCYRYSSDYRNSERGYRIGYASSKNLTHWIRDDSKAGLSVSDVGWDSEMVSYPHIFELDGHVYMAYLGNQVGRFGFGLAKLCGELV